MDEIEEFARARRRGRVSTLAGVGAVALVAGLTLYLTRPSPCVALVDELCQGTTAECSGIAQSLLELGVSDDECRETLDQLDAVLDAAPPDLEPIVRAEVLLSLIEDHVDSAQLEALRGRRDTSERELELEP